MAKKRESSLGRGLDALMGDTPSLFSDGGTDGVTMLPISKVEANSAQPRRNFEPEALSDLAESIAEHGIIQPITVRMLQSGYYQIISGERRWRAARQAGLEEVPVIIIEADDRKVTELSMIENLQREDLNPMEEAEGYQRLIDDFGLTQEETAQRVGKSRPTVANALRLLSLPEKVKQMVETGQLSAGHARAVLTVPDEAKQIALAEKAAEGLSVRQTEQLAKRLAAPETAKPRTPKSPQEVDYAAVAAQELEEKLGRKVRIVARKNKGHLELDYYDLDDLNDLLEDLAKLKKKG